MEALIVMKGDRDSALEGAAGNGNEIGPGRLERSTPRTREGNTAVGATRLRTLDRALGRAPPDKLAELRMSIQAVVVKSSAVASNPLSRMSRRGRKMAFTELAEITEAGERRPPRPLPAQMEPS